ncbi:MAG TPA: hypothetical protein VGQ38_06745 [Gaiellaceae bacterium]|jgi:hypothetical protein|nr:hypothetical protein [Gaiellaceae bacterium]
MPVDVSLPPVPGDPAGMRTLAAALRSDAAALATVATETARTLDGLEFFGPAATRVDGRVALDTRAAERVAVELFDAAVVLERSATDVEAAQAARERELERLRRELAPH